MILVLFINKKKLIRLQIQDGLWDVVGAVGAGVDVAEAANYLIVPIFCHIWVCEILFCREFILGVKGADYN